MGQLIKKFGKIKVSLPIPHLLTLQIDSYQKFLQEGVAPADRKPDVGLEGVFRTVFPIKDFNDTASLEFVGYEIVEPKYDQAECIAKGLTYEAPVRIKVHLVVYDTDENAAPYTVREIKGQDIYFGTLPLMTEKGTFIINGTERVIVNQLQRSPGIIFEHDGGKTHTSRKVLYSCRVIPMRGSWLDFDFDHKDILYVRIDRRRKMPATILFKAMGMSKTDILDYFYTREYYRLGDADRLYWEVRKDLYRKDNAYSDIVAPDGTVLVRAGKPITKRGWRQICESGLEAIEVRPDTLDGMFLAEDVTDANTGEVLAEASDELTPGLVERMREVGIQRVAVLHTKGTDTSSSIRDTLAQDRIPDMEKAQEEIYRRLRPSSPPTAEIAASFFDNLFRSADYYDLSPVGRYKLNQRLAVDPEKVEPGTFPAPLEPVDLIREGKEGEDLVLAVKKMGVNTRSLGRRVKTLIVNGLNPEPGVRWAEPMLAEHAAEIRAGLELQRRFRRAEEIMLAVPAGCDVRLAGIRTVQVDPMYPNSVNELMIREVTGEENPPDVAAVGLHNVWSLGRVALTGLPLMETVITIGTARDWANYIVKNGSIVGELLEFAEISLKSGDTILRGGPLRGESLDRLDRSITKGAYGFFVVNAGEVPPIEGDSPCINCGACIQICPTRIDPRMLSRYAEFGRYDMSRKENFRLCVDCGLCGYVCIARRPVLQYIRLAVKKLDEEERLSRLTPIEPVARA